MADYNSVYTGLQIDAGIAKANTARQEADSGWAQYTDTQYTVGSPLFVLGNTDTVLPNNAGASVITQKPADVASFYTAGKITGRNGDGILITINATLLPTSPATKYAELWFDIGGAIGEPYRTTVTFPKGNGVLYNFSTGFNGYTLDTWEANGATVYIRADGTMSVYDIDYIITRTHKAR